MVEIEACQEGIGFFVVAIFMAPAGIVFNPKAERVVLNWIDNSCLWGLKGFEVGCCDGFAANQVVQAMKKPATECIAVRTLFGMQLEDVVVIEDLISKANNEWSDVAPDIAEVSDFDCSCIVNLRENIL